MSGVSIETRFLYNGKFGVQTDSNGLYYMQSRYYSPIIKRFINRDVIVGNFVEPQSLNRFAYTNGNPISFIDPFGFARDSDSFLANAASTTFNFIPFVGGAKGVLEAFTGYDIFTKRQLNSWERGLSIASVIPGIRILSKGTEIARDVQKTSVLTTQLSNTAHMYRRTSNTRNFNQLSVPMQLREVKKVAEKAGIGLQGTKISIVRDDTLIGRDLYGYAYPTGDRITLYPDAFRSKEDLVKTLGHERTHIYQTKVFGAATDTETLKSFEDGAYASEDLWWAYYNRKG